MTAKQIIRILNLPYEHGLYKSDGGWFHHLTKFPGALFDANGYVLFNNKEEYLNNSRLQHGQDLNIKGGISSLNGYVKYTDQQRARLYGEKSNIVEGGPYEKTHLRDEVAQNRLARICWNNKGWTEPSGPDGKSNNQNLHEGKFKYGHEEWLLDISKLVDEYHYGFLEPVRKHQGAYVGPKFDVLLYTINGNSGRRFKIGVINKLEVLEKEESDRLLSIYKEKGWFSKMEEQIKANGANPQGFSDWKGVDLFNVRFRPGDLRLYDPYIEVPLNDFLYSQTRYNFTRLNFDSESIEDSMINFSFEENFESDEDKHSKSSSVYSRAAKVVEINFLHKDIRDKLKRYLQSIYGQRYVKSEHPAGYEGNKIDIVANDNGKLIYFEIKTYPALKTSIREAFGQLMEYAHWINEKRADELIIVTHIEANKQIRTYFKFLRDTYNINIFYQSFDLDSNVLSEKY
jgi:hypothetical protein